MTQEEKDIKDVCEDIQAICFVLDIIMVGLGLLMLCARWCI